MRKGFISSMILLGALLLGSVPAEASKPLSITHDGNSLDMDFLQTKAINGHVYLPLRQLSIMGALDNIVIDWLPKTNTVRILNSDIGRIVEIPLGTKTVKVDGQTMKNDQPEVVINNTTYVPVRFFSEYLNEVVGYNLSTNTVSLDTPTYIKDFKVTPTATKGVYSVTATLDPHITYVEITTMNDDNKGMGHSNDYKIVDGKLSGHAYFTAGAGHYKVILGTSFQNGVPGSGAVSYQMDGKMSQQTSVDISSPNTFTADLAATYFENSDSPDITALANSITSGLTSDMDKARAIHDWVATHIAYDYTAYLNNTYTYHTASETINEGKGVCGNYAIVTTALFRAAGLRAKYVIGDIRYDQKEPFSDNSKHAWVQVMVDGKWRSVDTTWDAGYIQNGQFVFSLTHKYFDPSPSDFSVDHLTTSVGDGV